MTTNTTKPQTKGERVLAYLSEHPEATRRQAAEAVGCTVARVGEVVRAAGLTTAKPAKAEPVRTERCEHERKSKGRLGSCKKGCPPAKEQ